MVPDIDGCVVQDFAVAVPAAVGGGASASRVVSAYLTKDLMFAILAQVQLQVRVTLAVTWCEEETTHPVDLNEVQIKLVETEHRHERGLGGNRCDCVGCFGSKHLKLVSCSYMYVTDKNTDWLPGRLYWYVGGDVSGSQSGNIFGPG